MKKTGKPSAAKTLPPDLLAAQGQEAVQLGRFKEAVELFKQAVRAEPRPDWQAALADAYGGRARDLAGKGMLKEAAMVLENTIAGDGAVRDSPLYVSCLVREGQVQKAATYLSAQLPEDPSQQALAAALLVSVPSLPDLPKAATPEQIRWRDWATACRCALASWSDGAPAVDIDRHLNAISLRSAFRPFRLLLKTLVAPAEDAERTRRVLDTVPPDGPWAALRQAVVTACLRDGPLDAQTWRGLSSQQQVFVAEATGLPAQTAKRMAEFSAAERAGPASLYAFLLRQTAFSRGDVRNACLNLLPHLPDRMSQFEKTFGPLAKTERLRLQALAGEAGGHWEAAARGWRSLAEALAASGESRSAGLAQGVIYRHLARLVTKHREIAPEADFADPVIANLGRACIADPGHLPSRLELIDRLRKDEAFAREWHDAVEAALLHFPDDARMLQQALDSALARKAFKQASKYATRLLHINPINTGVRRQMIDLQIAYARKQIRAGRPDLARKGLAEAALWERADSPSAPLRIVKALVDLSVGDRAVAEAALRDAVALAGAGVPGWLRARLEADVLKLNTEGGWLHRELTAALQAPPDRQAVLAVTAMLAQPEAAANRRLVASLLMTLRPWLEQAARIDWPPAEFQTVADMLARFEAFDVLRNYAQAAGKRDPHNPIWRFYDIVGRTKGRSAWLYVREQDELDVMAEAAVRREDFHMATRIARFIEPEPPRTRGRRAGGIDDFAPEDVGVMIDMIVASMPRDLAADMRQRVKRSGRERTVAELIVELQSAPMGLPVPPELLPTLCAAMVSKAMGNIQRAT